jgi:RNA polymerase sigma factor (sigma-70 family)
MSESATRPLARTLLRVVLGPADVPDRDLLARFAATRDEAAFAEIVRRHGPMVLAVGRRVTGHPQDAEDAFQAAFLVLARRAAQVNRPDQLANWLYGVAYRTALEARAARRRAQEHLVPAAPEPAARTDPDPHDRADLRRVFDEELARLPDKYRAAVVLCDLEGLPRADAAARLKIPEGTLSSRLAHARKVLAGRLTRRGVTASAPALTAALARDAVGGVPHTLIAHTARAAARLVPGGAVPPDLVSPSVSSLTDGVLKAMLASRLCQSFGLVLASGLIGLGAYGLAQVPVPNTPPPLPDVIPEQPPLQFPADEPVFVQQPQPKAEKVAAKGVEDDDVPLPATPAQAVVRVEEGKLIVRQRGYHYQPTVSEAGETRVVGYQMKSGVRATTHDAADVQVFDMKGNRLQPKAWREKLKADVHALIAFDGRLPNPRELTLFKDDVLLVVLPGPAAPATPSAAGYGVPTTAPALPVQYGSGPALTPPALTPTHPRSTSPRPGQILPSAPGLPTPTPIPAGAPTVPAGPGAEEILPRATVPTRVTS